MKKRETKNYNAVVFDPQFHVMSDLLCQYQIKELTSFVVVLTMFICIFGIGTHAIFCPNDRVDSQIITRLFAQPWMFLFGYSSMEEFAGIFFRFDILHRFSMYILGK